MDRPRPGRRGLARTEPALSTGRVVLAYLGLAVAWTWPAGLGQGWVGRFSDTPGTIWTISAAGRLLAAGLHDAQTAWPTGVDYLRPDSYVLLVVGALLQLVPAATLHAWLQVAGLVTSATAAEACARHLGATRPASLVAGVGYAFGGLGATVLLEGHVYQLVNPWLPLLLLGWWRSTAPDGRAGDGLLAGVAYVGCLATTGYFGLAAAALLGGVLGGALLERSRPSLPALGAALAVGLPVSLLYAWAFAQGGGAWSSDSAQAVGSPATLLNLLGPSAAIDGVYHGQVTALPATVLALFVAAPLVLRRRPGWRRVAVGGLVCLCLSLGTWLQTDPAGRLFPLPGALLSGVPGLHFLHFPARLGWGWGLAAGVVAARVAERLLVEAPVSRWVLPVLLGVDLFVYLGMPARQRVQPADVPSAYLADDGPVLDLFPVDVHPTRALDLRVMTLACAYQATHGRPIGDVCITTSPSESPRARLGRWIFRRALDAEPLAEPLASLGFTSVAFHADLFREGDRARLRAALAAIDPDPVVSRDGGEYVEAYRLPPSDADPRASWEALLGP